MKENKNIKLSDKKLLKVLKLIKGDIQQEKRRHEQQEKNKADHFLKIALGKVKL